MNSGEFKRGYARRLVTVLVTMLAIIAGSFVAMTPAAADVSPPVGDPATVTGDALPTVQINGIVWDQEVVGNVVYAAGSFSSARPAGAAAGTNETPRSNLLAYNIQTGALITSFAPTINAQVRSIEASPDGTRLYIVGDFTTVNGQTRNRIAAFDLPSGTLSSFNPNSNGTTIGVDATNSAVYFTGTFGRVSGQDRFGAAAVNRDGTLLPWAPVLGERRGRVVVVSPDGTKVVLGGDFPTLNGNSNPGYGLGMVSATDGSLIVPFQTNNIIRNAGNDAAILSLKSDADSFYGTGYVFGSGGNLEGSFRASWDTGALSWVNDCHGDTYDVQPMGDAVYAAGHSHYCGSLEGGFPQSDPWSFYRAIAVTKAPARITPAGLNLGYYDFGGNPAPKMLHWFPSLNTGTASGASQGPWTVNGNSEYLVYGGEFTRVNNVGQQGLVRFAVPSKSTNAQGPILWNTDWPASALPLDGSIRVTWPLNYDRDSEFLKYEVLRNNVVIKTFENVRSKSKDWGLPPMTYVDSAVVSGTSYTYRIRATDNEGHNILGGTVTATASGTATSSTYRSAVLADSPLDFWPLDDTAGTVSYDWAGASDLTVNSNVSRGVSGAILGDTRTAASFNGGSNGFASTTTAVAGPQKFGIEAWFKTTTTEGGKIVGFGSNSTGNSGSYDRHVYMLPNGKVTFGVYPGSSQTIESSAALNDGQWHHVSAGLSPEGMILYIDGIRVAQRSDVTGAQGYNGFWRIGGDSPWAGSDRFIGQIDEVAIYAAPLSKAQVAAHYTASGRTLEGSTAPTDAYGAAVYGLEPTLYWRLGESSGNTAADSSGFSQRGTYFGSVNKGTTGALNGVTNTAATFTDGQVISQNSYSNPRSYSLETWFKTSTTTGGKLIGFGNSPDGNSNNYDRHVYMTDAGKLVFGVWTGQEQTIRTDASFNDNTWHHVVATQGAQGMRLYVDGQLQGTNPNTDAQDYTGYWHVGGDVTWGPGDWAFDGSLDEVAVYNAPLTAADVSQHYALGSTGTPANVLPTASFTNTVNKLAVSVDGSASTDTDGTIAGYSWNWGDGSPDTTGATSTHTYAAGGQFTVTLTVTDNSGGTATSTALVTAVPNQLPVPSFTSSVTDLTVAVDAAASNDTDGTIASYAWNWGDASAAGSGATATHAYTASGQYTITLTVTDNEGATAQQTASVTVVAPVGAVTYARDDFNRTLASGLGSANVGGAWTLSNTAANYRVDGSTGVFVQSAGGAQRYAYLPTVSSTDTAIDVDVALPQRPVGGSAYYTTHVRRVGAEDYRARVVVAPTGAVTVQLQRTTTILVNTPTSLTVAAGDKLHVRAEATGTSPTTLRVKVWKVGTTEPTAWTSTTTDSTAGLQTAGDVGLGVYLGSGVTNVPFQTGFDNFWAGSSNGGLVAPVNVAPTAAFVGTPSGLTAAFDGSTSTDSDGTIASYAWDFGDGTTGTGVTASRTYATAGTYTVKLTVTDNSGATGTISHPVTVTAPAPGNQAPTAAFTTSVAGLTVSADASTSTDPDGTIASYAWNFGDTTTGTGATTSHPYAAAGTYTVTLTVTDNGGATATTTRSVTVTAAAAAGIVQDDFNRADGLLGTSPLGGAWTQTAGVANVGVDANRARLTTAASSQTRSATLNATTSDSTDLTFSFATSTAVTGGRMYVSALGRVVGADDYRARWLIAPNGSIQAQLSRGGTVLSWVDMTGITITPGAVYNVRLQVYGTGTTTLRSKIWADGQTEPQNWQLSTTDATAALQTAGYTGVSTYSSSAYGPLPYSVYVDNFKAVKVLP